MIEGNEECNFIMSTMWSLIDAGEIGTGMVVMVFVGVSDDAACKIFD